jgi:hypothetical protein
MKEIALIGDIAFNGLISRQPDANFQRYASIGKMLKSVRFVFANLEVPVRTTEGQNEYKNYIFFSSPDVTRELLRQLNIGCVSLANNHIYDCKMSGLKSTIELLDELKILHTGAGWEKKHTDPVIIDIDGVKTGFIAYVDLNTNPKSENFPELLINYFEPEKTRQDIKVLREKVDKVICSIHWGVEYSHYPTPVQIDLAHDLADSGADVIMGHHPHTMQPFEYYKNSIIYYSLGGLTYGDDVWEGKLRSLKRVTKKSYIPILSPSFTNTRFITTLETKGNYITITDLDIPNWVAGKWRIFHLSRKYKLVKYMILFRERILNRIHDYFFGYYRNFLLDGLNLKSIRKIRYLFRQTL